MSMANLTMVSCAVDRKYCVGGETSLITCQLTNKTGYSIDTVTGRYNIRIGTSIHSGSLTGGMSGGKWSNGTSKTFLFSFSAPEAAHEALLYNGSKTAAVELEFITDSGNHSWEDTYSNALYLIDAHSGLSIDTFNMQRCSYSGVVGDDQLYALLDLKISKGSSATGLTMYMYYSSTGTATTSSSYINLTSYISTAANTGYSGNYTLLRSLKSWASGSDWDILLVLADSYESVSARATLPSAWTNLDLSGLSSGGVAVGKFSGSTQGYPLFEVAYPSIFSDEVDMNAPVTFTDDVTVNGFNIAGAFLNSDSVNAQIGTWLAGSMTGTIYRKVVPFTSSISAGAESSASFSAFVSSVKAIVSLRGVALNDTGTTWFPLPMVYPASTGYNSGVWATVSGSTIKVTVRPGSKGFTKAFVVVEYI